MELTVESWKMQKGTSDIIVKEVTLLSKEDYEKYSEIIPPKRTWWWLKSTDSEDADCVFANGTVGKMDVTLVSGCVRPVIVCEIKDPSLKPTDKITVAGKSWTVLNGSLILCDDVIGNMEYRSQWFEIETYLNSWAEEKGLIRKRKTIFDTIKAIERHLSSSVSGPIYTPINECSGCPYENEKCSETLFSDVLKYLKERQTKIVRCRDCKTNNQCSIQFKFADADNPGDWFCAYGRRPDDVEHDD